MKYPVTMSVVIVQLSASSPATALVSVRQDQGKTKLLAREFDLGTLSDATDVTMWAQMAAASVCDGL